MSRLRGEVLKQFKNLHRTKERIFRGDENAINRAREEINLNFKRNKNLTDDTEIEKLVKLAKDVDVELKLNVVQAVEKEPGVFHVQMRKDLPLLDNTMFREDALIAPPTKNSPCKPK